jgi:succinate-semialdehyde dehydrogenase/glutarate-semialdehyde dehydrogenase
MAIASINPATGELLRSFEALTEEQVLHAIQEAGKSFREYRRSSIRERSGKLLRAAEILEQEKERFGRLMTAEMGKPIRAAVEEAAKCAWVCRYYGEHAEKFLAEEDIPTGATRSYVRYEPLGVILAVMPWNFPFWQVFRAAAPALAAGNCMLLKHASNVPQCALAIQDIFLEAGFPRGVFQTLLVGSDRVNLILAHPDVKAATLTGSEPAGSSVAGTAGQHIKKTVLELGGSDPFIVMESADLSEAVTAAVRARTINNGQSCIAAKRFILSEAIAEEFQGSFTEAMQRLAVGDPMDERTQVGPLATRAVLESLAAQVRLSAALGAKILTGGTTLKRPGFFYAPTVLTDIPGNSPASTEELFGPVAALFRAASPEEALQIANDTPFGLGSSAWTNDAREQKLFIEGIEAGAVFINGMVASDPRLPFGGIKRSGYGRELGKAGIREFTNLKTVWMKTPASAPTRGHSGKDST